MSLDDSLREGICHLISFQFSNSFEKIAIGIETGNGPIAKHSSSTSKQ